MNGKILIVEDEEKIELIYNHIEEIKDLEIVKYIDVLVDGPFKKEVKDIKLHWKGSANQRVIDVKKTIDSGKVVVLED